MKHSTRNQHAIAFLRMAAVQLLCLVDYAPEIAGELCHIARQLHAEADDLAEPAAE